MVDQRLNLYENKSVQGTLYIYVDDSNFAFHVFNSIKVELLLTENVSNLKAQSDESKTTPDTDTQQVFIPPKEINACNTRHQDNFAEKIEFHGIFSPSDESNTAPDTPLVFIPPKEVTTPDIKQQDSVSQKLEFQGMFSQSYEPKTSQSNPVTFIPLKQAITTGDTDKQDCPSQKIDFQEMEVGQFDCYNNAVTDDTVVAVSKNVITPITVVNKEKGISQSQNETSNVMKNVDDLSHLDLLTEIKHDTSEADLHKLKISSEQSLQSCSYCYYTFDSWEALKAHTLVKVTEEFNCDDCCEVFPYKAYLQVHKKANHGTSGASIVSKNNHYWYSCDICGALVTTITNLQTHTLIHTDEGIFKFQCCVCPQVFKERSHLSDHLKGHKKSVMIQCRKCNQMCDSKAALARHKLTCREIRCYICNIDFPNRTSRNHHYKDFHPNDILKCHLCTHLFSSQEELNSHIEKHSLLKKKQCTTCGLFFSRLKKHMLKHKKPFELNESDYYFCDKCPAKFTSQATFSRHARNHLGEKLYDCPNCPKSFSNCGALYKHIKRHSVLFPYACEVCGENCESIDNLKSHMLTHSDNNVRFPCNICSQSFTYRGSLDTHMREKHTHQTLSDESVTVNLDSNFTENQILEHTVPSIAVDDNNQPINVPSIALNDTQPINVTANTFLNNILPEISGLMDSKTYKFVIVDK